MWLGSPCSGSSAEDESAIKLPWVTQLIRAFPSAYRCPTIEEERQALKDTA
jgi:hypothetical protein